MSTQPFWEGLDDQRFLVQQCNECHVWVWVPKAACPGCLSEQLVWREASGRGVVYSHSTVRRAAHAGLTAPYVVAIVELAEGPRMLTSIIGYGDPSEVVIGAPVQISLPDAGSDRGYPFRLGRAS